MLSTASPLGKCFIKDKAMMAPAAVGTAVGRQIGAGLLGFITLLVFLQESYFTSALQLLI